MKKLIRTATIALSLDVLLKGQLDFLSKKYDVIAVSGEDKHLENVRQREKIKTINVTFQRKISPVKDFFALIKLYKVLKKEKPFIVHSITPKAGLLTMIAGYFANVPIRIHTFTGLIFPSKTGVMKKVLIVMDKVLCKFSTHIYPEGQGVKNDLISYKITSKPLKIIANGNVNGIDCTYFNPNLFSDEANDNFRNQLKIHKHDFVFIFVGRLVADKGINELISAFTQLSKEVSNCKLLLVGPFEQDLNPITETNVNEIKNNPKIINVGYQDDVRPYFAAANCLVFPSHREGFPNVVLQAGAMNLPSIVSDINGCNEIIIHNENGLIIPFKNELAIFDAMKLIREDKELYNKLRISSRDAIVSRFEQHIVWKAILTEYTILEQNV